MKNLRFGRMKETLNPQAEKTAINNEKELGFEERVKKLENGVAINNLMDEYDNNPDKHLLITIGLELLKKFGSYSEIPIAEYNKINEETGYEDAYIATVCRKLEEKKLEKMVLEKKAA